MGPEVQSWKNRHVEQIHSNIIDLIIFVKAGLFLALRLDSFIDLGRRFLDSCRDRLALLTGELGQNNVLRLFCHFLDPRPALLTQHLKLLCKKPRQPDGQEVSTLLGSLPV